MDAVPITWRARKGYVSAPTPEPEPEPTPPVTQIMVSHNYYVVVPQQQPLAYAAPIYQAPPVVAVAATVAASKKSSSAKSTKSSASKKAADDDDGPKVSPPPPPPVPATAAPFKAPAPAAKKASNNEPPALRAGMNYMFPAEHTKLHIFNKSSKVWEDKHTGKSFNFKIFNVATTFTPAMVIENVVKGNEPGKWAITEVVEKGDGAWAKGTTIEHSGERASCSLASMGWTAKRGDVLPPVWVVVHKV